MEKKGDLFNQLAIISDLLEKVNVDSTSQTIIIELSRKEFNRVYKMIESRVKFVTGEPDDTFNVRIGNVNIVFNMNNA